MQDGRGGENVSCGPEEFAGVAVCGKSTAGDRITSPEIKAKQREKERNLIFRSLSFESHNISKVGQTWPGGIARGVFLHARLRP